MAEKKNPNIYQRALDIVNHRINPDIPQGSSGGEGLQYDFIIVSEDGNTYSFEKGSYNAIASKIKSAPVTGIVRLCLDEYMQYSTHQIMNIQYVCVNPDEDTWSMGIMVFGAEGEFQLIINEDNTIVSA